MDEYAIAENDLPHLDYFLKIACSQRKGQGCLPFTLGLTPLDFVLLLQNQFAGQPILQQFLATPNDAPSVIAESSLLRDQLLELRRDEWIELRDLLVENRANYHPMELVFADILAAACLGGEHLWRDLGMSNRQELSELIDLNFPALSQKNSNDMKWKKFFYKQLCERGGDYLCRAPSCGECTSFSDCFGPEI